MEKPEIIKTLFLLARPAAGKSEIIEFLKGLQPDTRKTDFHLGNLHVIDDFPMIWSWFEEDDLLTKMGLPRIHTDEQGYFLTNEYWNLLIERINLEYFKHQRNTTNKDKLHETIIIEFSRGLEHGGYKAAFSHINAEILRLASILYINVSWEESLRKNNKRFNPDKPDSILEHSLPEEKMRNLYYETDWDELINNNPQFIHIHNISVPYCVMENEDDVTSGNFSELANRLKTSINLLWHLYITN